METITHLSPASTFDTMSTPEPQQQFLKLEDLHTPASSSSPAASQFDDCAGSQLSPPPPVIVQSKPAKKRKSWGQELPEPKTNLPPRKRAKTDDEKEQRRIERIKRNRAAAHNSRERKRQETETLAVALARANAELEAYRKLHGPLPASIILPEVTLCTDAMDTSTPSLLDSHHRDSLSESISRPASPVDSLYQTSPRPVKQEPLEPAYPVAAAAATHPAFDKLDAKSALSPASLPLDLTQHSAAMLCDLQCRTSASNGARASLTTTNNSNNYTTTSTPPPSWWTSLFLWLMASQLQTCSKTLLTALWMLSPSRMARMLTLASARRSTSRSTTSSTTPQPSRSTHRRLALSFDTATGLRAPRPGLGGGAATAPPTRSVAREARRAGGNERAREPAATRAPRARLALECDSEEQRRRRRQQLHHRRHQGRDDADETDGVRRGRIS